MIIPKIIRKSGRKRRYTSIFTKSIIVLIGIGLLPLVLMGISIYNAYSASIRETLLSNMNQAAVYVGKNTADLLDELEEDMEYIYEYQITEYDYFYELLEDDSISDNKKEAVVLKVLNDILYKNQYISHVLFVDRNRKTYLVMRPPEIMVNERNLELWYGKYYEKDNRRMRIIPTHETDYYYYSKEKDFTVAKNIMDTSTVESSETQALGTLYLDIKMEYLKNFMKEAEFKDGGETVIIDRKNKVFIYHPQKEKAGKFAEEYCDYLNEMTADRQYIKAGNNYMIYSMIDGTDWIVLVKIPAFNLENDFKAIRNTTLLIIGISAILLIIIYLFYVKAMNRPIQTLKETMEEIQGGNLEARADIPSNDEMGILANGLNQMAEKLQNHIRQVYIAKICQRDAKIEALNTQIQPHYLYNTLDVIRMTAVTNDDTLTAEMIDSLSSQLKYLMAGASDMVSLRTEIDSIRNYFKLIRIRYDNRFDLEVDVQEFLLECRVPQLIIQPVVENAVKYGLRPKEGEGMIAIYAKEGEEYLEITVMDNGVGMSKERLEFVQKLLEGEEKSDSTTQKSANIGLRNVNDRISLLFGEEYGLQINSYENIGTIVKYYLPMIEKYENMQKRGDKEHV